MPAPLRTVAALLALFAFALPAGATVVSAMGLCVTPPPGVDPCEMQGHEMPTPEAPPEDMADCCLDLDGPVRTEVVVPEAERLVVLAHAVLPSAVPAPPSRTTRAPEHPPAPSLRMHLAVSVLLI